MLDGDAPLVWSEPWIDAPAYPENQAPSAGESQGASNCPINTLSAIIRTSGLWEDIDELRCHCRHFDQNP
jgi:hypothetical protein